MRLSQKLPLTDAEIDGRLFWSAEASRSGFPRRSRPFEASVGFIGSDTSAQMLDPECNLILLSPENWRTALASELVNVVVIEPTRPDENSVWGGIFSDGAALDTSARQLIQEVRNAGVPLVVWLTADVGYRDLYLHFSKHADLTFCSDRGMAGLISDMGFPCHHLATAIQPAIHNPFIELTEIELSTPEILFDGWAGLLDNSALAPELEQLMPLGLGIVESRALVKAHRRDAYPEIAPAILGSVGQFDYLFLQKRAKILLQVAGTHSRQMAERHALEAAACRTCVFHLGELPEHDLRHGFAECFTDWHQLRARAAKLLSDPIEWLQEAQRAWRYVHAARTVRQALGEILLKAGIIVSTPTLPRATVLTPTIRPGNLPHVLTQFRAQKWPEKELIIVANTDSREEWDTELLASDGSENIVFLPRDYWASAALNIGANRSEGEYLFRMDDDDLYGENYVGDAMLHAAAVDPDMMGKQGAFVFSEERNALYWRPQKNVPPTVFRASDLDYRRVYLAGFTHAVRVSTLRERGYPEMAFGTADTSFLAREKEIGELRMAVLDPLNAVFERRVDLSTHTWRQELKWNSPQFEEIPYTPAAIMV